MKSPNPSNNPTYDSKAFRSTRSGPRSLRQSLAEFTPIDQMPFGEPWDLIKALYSQSDLDCKVMATILNGVVTERRSLFLLSKKLLIQYLSADPNVSRSTLNGTVYRQLMGSLVRVKHGGSFLRCLIEPSQGFKGLQNEFRAGAYTLFNPDILELLPWWPKDPIELTESERERIIRTPPRTQPESGPETQPRTLEYESEAEGESDNNNQASESSTPGLKEYLEELAKLERAITTASDPECEHDLLTKHFRNPRTPVEFMRLGPDSRKVRCAIILAKTRRILPPDYLQWGKSKDWNKKANVTFGQDLDTFLFTNLKLARES